MQAQSGPLSEPCTTTHVDHSTSSDVDDEKQQSAGSQSKGEVPYFIEDDMLTSLLYIPGL